MSKRRMFGLSTAAIVVGSLSVFAQTESRSPISWTQDTAQRVSHAVSHETRAEMRLLGCLIKEPDYRRAQGRGKGSFGGKGKADELVPVDAVVESTEWEA